MNQIFSQNQNQKGNVLFIVLVGIALFAALVMAMTRSSNTDGGAVMSQAEAKLHAASIMRFGSDVEQAVRRLTTIGGCDVTQVSFEKSPFDGSDTDYVNPNAPTDLHCHVYSPNGGQVEYITFDDKWKDEAYSTSSIYGDWFISIMCFGPGSTPNCNTTTETERRGSVVLYAPLIKKEICKEINASVMGQENIFLEKDELFNYTEPFKGTFTLSVRHLDFAAPHADQFFQQTMCVQSGGGADANSYSYYNTLFLREDKF